MFGFVIAKDKVSILQTADLLTKIRLVRMRA